MFKFDVRVFDKMPDGWRELKGALTAPLGYKWISNGKSFFSNEYESGLLKIENDVK